MNVSLWWGNRNPQERLENLEGGVVHVRSALAKADEGMTRGVLEEASIACDAFTTTHDEAPRVPICNLGEVAAKPWAVAPFSMAKMAGMAGNSENQQTHKGFESTGADLRGLSCDSTLGALPHSSEGEATFLPTIGGPTRPTAAAMAVDIKRESLLRARGEKTLETREAIGAIVTGGSDELLRRHGWRKLQEEGVLVEELTHLPTSPPSKIPTRPY